MIEPVAWRSVDDVPALERGEVHLWWQDLNDPFLDHGNLAALLNERERRRVARWQVDKVKREFTVARGLLKVLLSRYLETPPAELGFKYGPLGKPFIPSDIEGGELCFNYTDAGGFALYAFAWGIHLGVDLEHLSRRGRFRRIIERRFAERESGALLAAPDDELRRKFLACWTRKEGYGKALGVGIRFPFNLVEMCEDCDASPLTVEDHIEGEAWDIHQLYPTKEFVGSLVHPRGEMRQRCFRLQAIPGLIKDRG